MSVMMLFSVILGSVLLLPYLGTGSTEQNWMHYAILAPRAFRVSTVYNVTATCYNVTSTVNLALRLQSDKGVLARSEATLEEGVTKIVSLQVPDDVPEATYTLYAEGTGGLSFNASHSVSISRKTLSIFVQMDKAMYKPGQTVLFRVIVIYPDLKPYQGFVDVAVFDQVGNKIRQWKKQIKDTGVISQTIPLSAQTPLGDWQIVVSAGGNSFTKTFLVSEYVLPKIEVTVSLPTYFLLNRHNRDRQSELPIAVIARYTYGQPVKGRATITVQLKAYKWELSNYAKNVMDVQLLNGKADVRLTIEDILALASTNDDEDYFGSGGYFNTPDAWNVLTGRTLLVVADVNETATGMIYSGTATVDFKSDKYQLNFLQFSPNNFKPGLLYTAFLQLSKMDGSPPDLADVALSGGVYRNISVLATMNHVRNYGRSDTYVPATTQVIHVPITPTGYMSCSLMINSSVESFNLEASLYINVTNSKVQGNKHITAFKSRDQQGIQVSFNSEDGFIKSNQNAVFAVKSTEPITVFQYQILSKGNVLLSDNVFGEPSTEHSFSIWISKELAMELAPNVRVLVWFITDSGEIVTDSTEISINDIFANEVSISFDQESTTPSENVSLTINAYPGSYVGLLAVDTSVLLLKSGNDITQEMVSNDLRGYDSVPDDHHFSEIDWMEKRRKRSIWWPRFIDGSDSKSILEKAGLFLLTDGYIYLPSFDRGWRDDYYGYAIADSLDSQADYSFDVDMMAESDNDEREIITEREEPMDQPSTIPRRVNFPETWLWTDETSGPDGKVTIRATAPDTITSWVASAFGVSSVAGLGIAAEKAQLTVFKPFFISPNLPYSVIRGEEIALQVTVFNYLSNPLDVSVTLKESTYYKVHGSTSSQARVGSNDASSVYFWIFPEALGQIPIEISAQTPVAGDAVKVMLLVKPEGIQQQYSTSTFIQLPSTGSTYNLSLPVSLPPTGTLVPGSEHLEVTVIGDLMGPSVKGLDSLLKMPYGCGEQNMLTLAPDVYIVKYLTISRQLTADIESKALGFMNAGYQRELTYQRSDGSFSAFGNRDSCGSIWLSSFVIDVFRQADDYISVEDVKIAQTMQWVIANQAANGSFAEPPLGRVLQTDMQGGSSRGLALTAYVFIALLQNRNNSQVDSAASIALARKYLEDQVSSATSDPYALGIIAYALSLAHSPKVSEVLKMLEPLAKVEAGTKHWEKPAEEVSPDAQWSWSPPYSQARAINIEMTSYVLRTYCQLKNISMSLPIAKWIIAQRNANGGFSSTQDTVVALAALADFASLVIGPSGERNIEVTLATDTVKHSFSSITDETAILLQSYQLPSETKEVVVSATGRGAVLVQLNAIYNVYKTNDASGIDLDVNTKQNGSKITITSCSSWKKNEGSGMVVMEVNQLTGYDVSNLDDLRNRVKAIKRVENNDGKVVLYFDELTESEICVDVVSDKVFPVSKLKDAPVKVYPYYDPSGGRTMFYSAPQALSLTSPCEECPQCCVEKVEKVSSAETGTNNIASSHLKMPLVTCVLLIFCQLYSYVM